YRNRTDEGWSQIDVQLRRRYDLIPNLVQTVEGYAAHERETFEEVTNARSRAESAQGVAGQADAENAVSSGLRQLLAVAEYYNDQVRLLNTAIQSFPSSVLANIFHFSPREFFDIEDAVRAPVQVDFEG